MTLRPIFSLALLVAIGRPLLAQSTLLPSSTLGAFAQELSGESAKRNLEYLTRLHRMRGSKDFHTAAEFLVETLHGYGLSDAHIERFPADGRATYGTLTSRLGWEADSAELWELSRNAAGDWMPAVLMASYQGMPIVLAEDSENADTTADLVDVGNGTAERDYAGRDVRGKIVLAAGTAGPVARLAVAEHGAAGILSYAQNQPNAWWGEDENLIRWGHLDSYAPTRTFAFQLSLKQARTLQARLGRGERIRLHAKVRAGRHASAYEVVTATIPGADPQLRSQEIAYSCHLDHQRPGANDNASGCATILEVARGLSKLIAERKLAPPKRTMRFIWPPEIEGSIALLASRPDTAARIKAVVHMDMVGGGPATKAVFHVTRGPASLPSFVYDVGAMFGAFVNQQTYEYAASGSAAYPLAAAEGGKEPLEAQLSEFTMGSDHDVYQDGSFGIPAIYLNDWPDRYIHTNYDSPAIIDPTKLQRAAFIGATSGYFLANATSSDAAVIWRTVEAQALRRSAAMMERRLAASRDEADNLTRFELGYERAMLESLGRFFPIPDSVRTQATAFLNALVRTDGGESATMTTASGQGAIVYSRNAAVKGPIVVSSYDYLMARLGAAARDSLRLIRFSGLRSEGPEYAYEVLNFVDGRRTVADIRDAVSAEYGPVPIELVTQYLRALEAARVVSARSATR